MFAQENIFLNRKLIIQVKIGFPYQDDNKEGIRFIAKLTPKEGDTF